MSKLQFGDIQEMFQKLSVPEIQRALNHSQLQSQKVQQQLRELVSQRYPDLLESAGTVLEMKEISNEIQDTLRGVPQLGLDIANHTWGRLPSYLNKIDSEKQDVKPTTINWMTYPERIWNALDNQQFLLATKILFEEHKSTSSLVSLTTAQLAQKRQFAQQITRQAKRTFNKYVENEAKVVIEAISTLVIFGHTMKEALEILLARRKLYIQACVKGSSSDVKQTTTTTIFKMEKILNSMNDTILQVNDGFVKGSVLMALKLVVKHLKMGKLEELLKTAKSIMVGATTKTATTTAPTKNFSTSAQECSSLMSSWLMDIVSHINEQENVLLPTTMSAHDLASIQQILTKSTLTLANQVVPYLSRSSSCIQYHEREKSTSSTFTNLEQTTTLHMLYSNIFSKRGSILLNTALDKAVNKYIDGIKSGIQRIDSAMGKGSKALGDSTATHSSSTASAFSFSKKNKNAKQIREHAFVESIWSLNYGQVLTMDLSSSLLLLLEDANHLSGIQSVSTSNNSNESNTLLKQITCAITLSWEKLIDMIESMINDGVFDDSEKKRQRSGSQCRNTMDHVLLLGACASLLSKLKIGKNVVVMNKETRQCFVALTKKSLEKWSKQVMKESCETFEKNVSSIIQNGVVVKRYGWTKVSLGSGSILDDDGDDDDDHEDAAVDMPTLCSPYIVEMLYSMYEIIFQTSSLNWCNLDDEIVPSKIILKEMWSVIVDVLTNTVQNGIISAITDEKDILQFVLDIGVLEKLSNIHSTLSSSKLKTIKTKLEGKIDPVEWTLYESLLEQSICNQIERMKFYTTGSTSYDSGRSGKRTTSFTTYGYSETSVSQNILPMASTPGRFPLLPVARTMRKKSFDSPISSLVGSPEKSRQQAKTSGTSGVTQAATTLFSSITTSFWGD
jgi:hypothetical protein